MMRIAKRSISSRLMLVIMATTLTALVVYAVVMLAYDLTTYRDSIIKDLTTQANIIAEVSTPALEFNDPATGKENLDLLRTRPMILRAVLYTDDGSVFAEYSNDGEFAIATPQRPQTTNQQIIDGNRIHVWQQIAKNGVPLGAVYIHARYELGARLAGYAIILCGVLVASLGLALLVATWLRGAVTKPIFAVTNVARQVMQSRDFSLRAQKFTEDEIGVLVDAFNDMLSEVERRARALEASNQSLEHEMGERQAAEDALRLADRRKDEFLATLAHELRNPLAPLINGLHILRAKDTNPAIAANAQSVMERQLKQMVRLVDDLLDVSRITTGKLTISKTRIDVQSIMRDAVEASRGFIENCGHQLNVTMPDELLYIDADPIRLAQVFSNLLNNAAKYTNRGGLINFTGQLLDDKVVVEVTDNGIGLAPDMLDNIFHMFTQVDQTLERTHAGLGVGLALAKRLVELHGGQLVAHSGGPGLGSSFRVYLTCASAPVEQADQSPGPAAQKQSLRRILLVDDNVDYVATMATLLSALGHDVRTAHEGSTAQHIARNFMPEFAFLDIGMPGLNGYDLARLLRQFPETRQCVLVAVTGWGQEKDRDLSRLAGFNHHLVKPVELAQILAILEQGTALVDDTDDGHRRTHHSH